MMSARNLENAKQTYLLVLDFWKAFDKVSRGLLLHKLNHYDTRGSTLGWIKAFWSDRCSSGSEFVYWRFTEFWIWSANFDRSTCITFLLPVTVHNRLVEYTVSVHDHPPHPCYSLKVFCHMRFEKWPIHLQCLEEDFPILIPHCIAEERPFHVVICG